MRKRTFEMDAEHGEHLRLRAIANGSGRRANFQLRVRNKRGRKPVSAEFLVRGADGADARNRRSVVEKSTRRRRSLDSIKPGARMPSTQPCYDACGQIVRLTQL